MKKEFKATTPSKPVTHTEKVPVNSISVDAVNFIMENVFDWEAQKEHAGLRMTYEDCKTLVKSLKANLAATCPDVGDHDVTDLYGELLHNNWAGELQDIKDLTEKVVTSYLEAEMGNFEPIIALKRQMKGKITYMEKHYSDVGHKEGVPMHIVVEAMDKSDKAGNPGGNPGASLESRKSSVLALIQNKRGDGMDDLFDGEHDPALLKIMESLTKASTDEELVDALEAFEDYMMNAELDAMIKSPQTAGVANDMVAEDGAAVAETVEAQSFAARLKQKLPGLTRFFG